MYTTQDLISGCETVGEDLEDVTSKLVSYDFPPRKVAKAFLMEMATQMVVVSKSLPKRFLEAGVLKRISWSSSLTSCLLRLFTIT